ncbi:class F sortase [Patescibacteria group bacterium]|nr:class F sortase [Patescibacteria group bacterium]
MRDIVCLTAFGRRAEWLGLACPYATILSPAQLFYMLEIDRSTRFKNLLITTILLVVVLFVIYFNSTSKLLNIFSLPSSLYESLFKINVDTKEVTQEVLSAQEVSVFSEISKPIYGFPKEIRIDSLGISANIISVGVDVSGHLETPKKWDEVGWYSKGSNPSEKGNLLLNAHYDDNYGNPAAFYRLKNIKTGDKVSVLDSYGRVFDYKVTNVFYVSIDDPDRTRVFEPYKEDTAVMTLITCGGVWSSTAGTYDKRLVVNAELIQE